MLEFGAIEIFRILAWFNGRLGNDDWITGSNLNQSHYFLEKIGTEITLEGLDDRRLKENYWWRF